MLSAIIWSDPYACNSNQSHARVFRFPFFKHIKVNHFDNFVWLTCLWFLGFFRVIFFVLVRISMKAVGTCWFVIGYLFDSVFQFQRFEQIRNGIQIPIPLISSKSNVQHPDRFQLDVFAGFMPVWWFL